MGKVLRMPGRRRRGGNSDGPGAPIVELRPVSSTRPKADVTALFERAAALEYSDERRAIGEYRELLAHDPAHSDAHINLGRLLHEAGDVALALRHYETALAIRPDCSVAAFNVAVAMEDLGDHDGAANSYRRAIELDPCSADAHYNVGRLLEQMGRNMEAIRHLHAYRKLRGLKGKRS